MRSKISYAVAAILGGASFGAAAAEPAAGTTEGGALEEIIVTAQKREQSIQDVPISMQALTGQALQQLDRKSTRLNSSHRCISYAVFCLKKKKQRPHCTSATLSRHRSARQC